MKKTVLDVRLTDKLTVQIIVDQDKLHTVWFNNGQYLILEDIDKNEALAAYRYIGRNRMQFQMNMDRAVDNLYLYLEERQQMEVWDAN